LENQLLLEYGLKNFYSFKEGVTVSFKLDENCPPKISRKKHFSNVLCVKGANGSGKTHLLKGLSFLGHFCSSSFNSDPDTNILTSGFFDSKEPCELFAEFSIENTLYRYEVELTEREVKRETLYRTKSKKTKVFERIGDELTLLIGELESLRSVKLRKNASIISMANQYGLEELKDIHIFFKSISTNVGYSGLRALPGDIDSISKYLDGKAEIFNFVKSFIADCDVGISDIKIHSKEIGEDKKTYYPIFYHKANGKSHPVTVGTESSGTKALFRSLARYKLVLIVGGVLVLDEFDINLHPHILPKLIGLFLNKETNKRDAQLIFSTHNSEILDILGRYRTYLVNKESNESYAYRLDEIPGDILRNDRSILPIYNDGKIGGIPKI
jgi:uncharacterized protein